MDRVAKVKKKIKILCPVECKSGSRCNADQDCPKGQCTNKSPYDGKHVRTCVCDKDCKQGSRCYPHSEPCDGNGICKQVGMYKHTCECGEGNNNKKSSMDHPFRTSAIWRGQISLKSTNRKKRGRGQNLHKIC